MDKALARRVFFRLVVSMVIALVIGAIISESSYLLVNDRKRENPETLTLTIPAGTADRIAAGEAVPSLPKSMSFIEGDVLLVKNEDSVSHQLGPIWVPPGATGKLNLGEPNLYSYSCSFQPTQYLGLDVQQRLTAGIRMEGILSIGLPSGVLLWLYSLLIFPLDRKKQVVEAG